MVTAGEIRKLPTQNGSITVQVIAVEPSGDCVVQCNGVMRSVDARAMAASRLCCKVPLKLKRRREERARKKPDTFAPDAAVSKMKRRAEKHAYIYMLALNARYVKIGRSRCPEKRVKSFKTGATQPIALLDKWRVPALKAAAIETELKHKFAETFSRSAGGTEVFKLQQTDRPRAARIATQIACK